MLGTVTDPDEGAAEGEVCCPACSAPTARGWIAATAAAPQRTDPVIPNTNAARRVRRALIESFNFCLAGVKPTKLGRLLGGNS